MLGEQTGIFKAYTLLACLQTSPTCIFFVAVRKKSLQNAITNHVPASFSGYSTLNKSFV